MAPYDSFALSIRAYSAYSDPHSHDFSQLVLPLVGSLNIDIAGRDALLDRSVAAYVESGARHAQGSRLTNRFLIVDLDPGVLDPWVADRLASQPLLQLTPEANSLIDYMGATLAKGAAPASRVRLWAPLLLDSLVGDEPQPRSRLGALLAAIDGNPFSDWTATRMAKQAGMSVSRLHAHFRKELNTTPHAWLSQVRLGRVQHWLTNSDLPIAELAYRGGYADQSALTRALRKATGLTPAAYRRQTRESRPKERDS